MAAIIDEEWLSLGAESLVESYRADGAILAEQSDLELIVEHGGFAWFEVISEGVEAAGIDPDRGVDAITLLAPVLQGIAALDAELATRPAPAYGRPSVHASTISGGSQFPAYPTSCVLGIERCTVAGETVADARAEVDALLDAARASDSRFTATARLVVGREPVKLDSAGPLVQALEAEITRHRGAAPRHLGDIGWADSGLLVEAGIPCVIFGPDGCRLPHGRGVRGARFAGGVRRDHRGGSAGRSAESPPRDRRRTGTDTPEPPPDHDPDGRLTISGCALADIAEAAGTPALVIDEDDLRASAREYLRAFRSRRADAAVYFASKALSCSAVIAVMADEGLGCDVSSAGELAIALAGGMPAERILMHGNAKRDIDLSAALDAGVGLIVIDSLDELARLQRVLDARRPDTPQRVLLRVNPGVTAPTHAAMATGDESSKFGLGIDALRAAMSEIAGQRADDVPWVACAHRIPDHRARAVHPERELARRRRVGCRLRGRSRRRSRRPLHRSMAPGPRRSTSTPRRCSVPSTARSRARRRCSSSRADRWWPARW